MERTIVFDNDGTLYTVPEELKLLVGRRMENYLSRVLGLPQQNIARMRAELKAKYQLDSTFSAFHSEYQIDFEEFERETFLAVDLAPFFSRDQQLVDLFSRLPGKKLILTNNPSSFARRVVSALGIESFFEDVFGEKEMEFHHKPEDVVFQRMLGYCTGTPFMVDDSLQNLLTARRNGFRTVLVGESQDSALVDYHIRRIHDLVI